MSDKIKLSKEQKDKIAQEAIESGNMTATAQKYQIPITSIYNWVKAYRQKDLKGSLGNLKELKRKNEEQELEIAILKELLKKTTQVLIKN